MRILIITDQFPFPPKNGVQLPIYHLIRILSKDYSIDLNLIVKDRFIDDEAFYENTKMKEYINEFRLIKAKKYSNIIKIINEIFLLKPTFYYESVSKDETIKNKYDLIWCSPIGSVGIADEINMYKKSKIGIGLHESTVYSHLSSFNQIINKTLRFRMEYLIKILRVPWIWYHEKKILNSVNIIQVQTPLEKKRISRLYGKIVSEKVVIAHNGRANINKKSENYGKDNLVFFTHLSEYRKHEAEWFLKKVWPIIIDKAPNITLSIVGTPPDKEHNIEIYKSNSVLIKGYVDDLNEVYSSATVCVVPTQHNVGWVNRVADALTFGVPIVACSGPLLTIPGLIIGKHALKGDSVIEFANNVIKLIDNEKFRQQIVYNGKILSKSFNSWDDSINHICSKIYN
jgi:polysaccharide biosynthesis protein PslH